MARERDVHVVARRNQDGWRVTQGRCTLSNHRTQARAVSAGKRIASRNNVELVTHARNGRIRSKDSFGNESAVRDTEH